MHMSFKNTLTKVMVAGNGAIASALATAQVAFAADPGDSSTWEGGQGVAWGGFAESIVSIFIGIRPFVIALVTVALIVEAIGCIIGGEQSRERFKHGLPWVIGAAVLIMVALTVASGIVSSIGDDDWTQAMMYFRL